jgi:NarL family two-component system response regulator LiaR
VSHCTLTYGLYPIVYVGELTRKYESYNPKSGYVKSILIVDDSPLIRRSLRNLFEQQPDWAICGEAENGCEGIDKAQKLHPDLIVIDLAMPHLNGIDASRMLKRLLPTTPIVMFTTFADPHIKKAALAAGVRTVIAKSEGAMPLFSTIQEVFAPDVPSNSAA